MRKALSIFVVMWLGVGCYATDYHINVVENLPTASPYVDSVAAARGGAGTANVTDTLAVIMRYSDSVVTLPGHGAVLSDTLSHSDSVANVLGRKITPEGLSYSDNVTASKGATASKSSTDTINVALSYRDSVSAVKNLGGSNNSRSITETLTYSDVAGKGVVINLADTFILTSSVCANSRFSGLSESLILTDQVTINAQSGGHANSRQVDEFLVESDGASKQLTISINPSDSFTYSDLVSGPFQNNPINVSDFLTLTDHVSSPFSTSGNIENFTFTDAVVMLSSHSIGLRDSFVYTDGIKACTNRGPTNCHRRGQVIAFLGR